jgi:hypothetical protein
MAESLWLSREHLNKKLARLSLASSNKVDLNGKA